MEKPLKPVYNLDELMKVKPDKIRIKDYDYPLPPNRIALFPLPRRDASRLLIYDKGRITDSHFSELDRHIPSGSALILNNTRVIEARILFQKASGGIIEIFCLAPYGQSIEVSLAQTGQAIWQCLIGGASKWKHGLVLEKKLSVNGETALLKARYTGKQTENFIISFSWEPAHLPFASILHAAGAIPLPPYIKREVTASDEDRYQTVFSKHEGSVAAPTAALHFTPESFERLSEKDITSHYITLHVGAGTFKPVKTETVDAHEMHEEPFMVSMSALEKIILSNRIIAVGTTSLRALESLHWLGIKLIHGLVTDGFALKQWEAYELSDKYGNTGHRESLQALVEWMKKNEVTRIMCTTSLIIVPGYQFNIPSGLITNFHQPQSTLLLLVSAFIGDDWKKVYRHALEHGYRFLSYGDSSLLWKNDG